MGDPSRNAPLLRIIVSKQKRVASISYKSTATKLRAAGLLARWSWGDAQHFNHLKRTKPRGPHQLCIVFLHAGVSAFRPSQTEPRSTLAWVYCAGPHYRLPHASRIFAIHTVPFHAIISQLSQRCFKRAALPGTLASSAIAESHPPVQASSPQKRPPAPPGLQFNGGTAPVQSLVKHSRF